MALLRSPLPSARRHRRHRWPAARPLGIRTPSATTRTTCRGRTPARCVITSCARAMRTHLRSHLRWDGPQPAQSPAASRGRRRRRSRLTRASLHGNTSRLRRLMSLAIGTTTTTASTTCLTPPPVASGLAPSRAPPRLPRPPVCRLPRCRRARRRSRTTGRATAGAQHPHLRRFRQHLRRFRQHLRRFRQHLRRFRQSVAVSWSMRPVGFIRPSWRRRRVRRSAARPCRSRHARHAHHQQEGPLSTTGTRAERALRTTLHTTLHSHRMCSRCTRPVAP